MVRSVDNDRLAEIVKAIREHPRSRPGAIARLLGLHRSAVIRALPALEEAGFLIAEDEKGRLTFIGWAKPEADGSIDEPREASQYQNG
jgi:Mn-dependent DtxR family transcriptional regulator